LFRNYWCWQQLKDSCKSLAAVVHSKRSVNESVGAYVESVAEGKTLDIAQLISNGILDESPFLEGVVIACILKALKGNDKSTALRGQWQQMSERQRQRVQEAAVNLCKASNKSVMTKLGLNPKASVPWKPRDDMPAPFGAVRSEEVLSNIDRAAILFRRESDPSLMEFGIFLDETVVIPKYDLSRDELGDVRVFGGVFHEDWSCLTFPYASRCHPFHPNEP